MHTVARTLDQQDELAYFRDRFIFDNRDPAANLIYLDGNSLGRLPRATIDHMHTQVEALWGERLIRGWNDGWIHLSAQIGAKIARLIGAGDDEVIVADSTSVNLFKLVVAALRTQATMSRGKRTKIVTDDLNFPSDVYILSGAVELMGPAYRVEIVPSPDGIHGPVDALAAAIDEETALVTLSHTCFKSSYTYDMTAITALAQSTGAMMLWDLSHSAGAVPATLNDANVDLAVGCTYKYLNGGPGAPAFLYVRRDWQNRLLNPITGWMGQHNMFDFRLDYEPAPGLRRFLSGTPTILSLAAIEPGVDLLIEAGMARLRAKSVAQSEYAIALWKEWLAPLGFTLNSPRDPAQRGSHISLGHVDGWRINRALIEEMSVLPDFRKPDNIRLGIAPLYNSFTDIYEAMARLRAVVVDRLYEKYSTETSLVT